MDNYWDRNRQSNYFLSMASLEANHLVNVATSLSQFCKHPCKTAHSLLEIFRHTDYVL